MIICYLFNFFLPLYHLYYNSCSLYECVYFILMSLYTSAFVYFTYVNFSNHYIKHLNKSLIITPSFLLINSNSIQLFNSQWFLLLLLTRFYYMRCPLRMLTNSTPSDKSLSFVKKNIVISLFSLIGFVRYYYNF